MSKDWEVSCVLGDTVEELIVKKSVKEMNYYRSRIDSPIST